MESAYGGVMSIWGKRVDGWFARGVTATREDYNRAGLNALWQVALVLIVLVVAYLIGTEL